MLVKMGLICVHQKCLSILNGVMSLWGRQNCGKIRFEVDIFFLVINICAFCPPSHYMRCQDIDQQ